MKNKKYHKEVLELLREIYETAEEGYITKQEATSFTWECIGIVKSSKLDKKRKADLVERALLSILIINDIVGYKKM